MTDVARDARRRPSGADGGLSRRAFLRSAAAATLAPLVPAAVSDVARPPNVLFVLSDSHRARAAGCYGHGEVRTPHFDALAAQGVRLTTAISNTPLCRPYRASLMSGAYGHQTGVLTNTSKINFGMRRGHWRPRGLPTLGDTFSRNGYCCGYVGKWHLGSSRIDPGPERRGFDDYWVAAIYPPHDYFTWSYATGEHSEFSGGGYFRPILETNLAIDFICRQTAPWFMVLSWGPPHDPFTPPPEYSGYHGAITLPPNVPRGRMTDLALADLPAYYGLVEAIDHELGRLLDALDELGIADDTLVIYTSDHGLMMGSHGLSGKDMPYDESLRVPFLARWPGRIPAGSVVDMPFGTPDIFPTMAGLAGLPAPAGVAGTDFSDLLLGRPDARRQDSVYIACHENEIMPWPGWRGVRTERYLYARKERQSWLLFDREDDPDELRNLKQDRPSLRKELDELTHELMGELGDGWRT